MNLVSIGNKKICTAPRPVRVPQVLCKCFITVIPINTTQNIKRIVSLQQLEG